MPYNTLVHRIHLETTSLEAALNEAVACLERGELILYPTETTYGLGADATNPNAIERLLQYKTNRGDKALSVLVADQAMAEHYIELNATAKQAYQAFLPGPVTVVSVGKHQVAPGVESASGGLGIRISSHPVAQALIEKFGRPITATSANASGKKRPYAIEDILATTSARQQSMISLAIDAGTLPPNEPSTVIDTTLESLQVLRQGTALPSTSESLTLASESDTLAWGKSLATRFRSLYGYKPVIFALSGPMGVGKTHLTKGLAAGLGISETVTSPSFTLLHEYSFVSEDQKIPFWHIDAWRLERAEELSALGINELMKQNGVLVLEWANLPQVLLENWPQAEIISIELAYTASSARQATLTLENHV
jgi:L-threonylcarbamoyladenylate synthase